MTEKSATGLMALPIASATDQMPVVDGVVATLVDSARCPDE
jgi:hypothetical protein